jgi:hypothetical protein
LQPSIVNGTLLYVPINDYRELWSRCLSKKEWLKSDIFAI